MSKPGRVPYPTYAARSFEELYQKELRKQGFYPYGRTILKLSDQKALREDVSRVYQSHVNAVSLWQLDNVTQNERKEFEKVQDDQGSILQTSLKQIEKYVKENSYKDARTKFFEKLKSSISFDFNNTSDHRINEFVEKLLDDMSALPDPIPEKITDELMSGNTNSIHSMTNVLLGDTIRNDGSEKYKELEEKIATYINEWINTKTQHYNSTNGGIEYTEYPEISAPSESAQFTMTTKPPTRRKTKVTRF